MNAAAESILFHIDASYELKERLSYIYAMKAVIDNEYHAGCPYKLKKNRNLEETKFKFSCCSDQCEACI